MKKENKQENIPSDFTTRKMEEFGEKISLKWGQNPQELAKTITDFLSQAIKEAVAERTQEVVAECEKMKIKGVIDEDDWESDSYNKALQDIIKALNSPSK